ncbi:MAG: FtsX-like permease family protein, partial [Eubacteriales bacterium]|nr:FtsX-like permease family protein [Eubacteriales bacterium]
RYYLIVPDDEAVLRIVKASNLDDRYEGETFYYGFDTDSPDDLQLDAKASVHTAFRGHALSVTLVCEQWADFVSIYGGLFFVGIILGLLFLMATVLIIYYKQVSEGFDDASRFEIMKKVGLSDNEVRGTVRSQVLTVFFLPLCAAFLHVAFAFPMILRMLRLFSLDNTLLFVVTTAATCLAFALVYTVIYGVTARSYYRIVNAA